MLVRQVALVCASLAAFAVAPSVIAQSKGASDTVALAQAPRGSVGATPGDVVAYKQEVAQKIATAGKMRTTKAGVKALSVVGYTIDTRGSVSDTWIVRSSGDTKLDELALNTFRQAMPLPVPPASAFGDDKEVSLSEAFVFTTDGNFRLQTLIK